jgi:hypothetical protein
LENLARVPVQLAEEVLQQLPGLLSVSTDASVDAAKERQLKRYCLLLEEIQLLAEFLESSDVLAIPAEFASYLESTSQDLIPNSLLCLRADNDFNYSFEPLANSLNGAIAGTGLGPRLPEPLALFRFPSVAKDDALLHAILAHEVGHYFDEHANVYGQVLANAGLALFQQTRSEVAAGLGLDLALTTDSFVADRAMSVFDSWLREIICDIVGVRLLGPAFAFAALEITGIKEEQSLGSPTHPPAAMRLNVVQQELESVGWLDTLLRPRSLWEDCPPYIARAIDPSWPLDIKAYELIAQRIIQFVPSCQAVIRAIPTLPATDPNRYLTDEPEMRGLITGLVPPGERVSGDGTTSVFSPYEIINACWMFWAEGTPGWDTSSPFENRLTLGRLMLKALEIEMLRRRLT